MAILISFEGVPGSGKTTQMKIFLERLKNRGYPTFAVDWGVRKYEFPEYLEYLGTTNVSIKKKIISILRGDRNRLYFDLKLPYTSTLLILAKYAVDWEKILRNLLPERNLTIVCDRNLDTLYAHQLIYIGRGQSQFDVVETLGDIRRIALTWFREPDYTIYMKVTSQTALKRLTKRDKKTLASEDSDTLRQSIEMYNFLSDIFKDRYIVIDGEGSPERIADNLWKRVFPLIEGKIPVSKSIKTFAPGGQSVPNRLSCLKHSARKS